MTVLQLGEAAKAAKSQIANADSRLKDIVLKTIAKLLVENTNAILAANKTDLANAADNGIGEVMSDRLRLTESRINNMANALIKMADLEDPVGIFEGGSTRPNGLKIMHKRVPIGVVALIYESRPNVTIDAACLCIKAGNAVLLRGGKEAIHSNIALVDTIKQGLRAHGLSEDIVGLVLDTTRESAKQLMELTGYVDLLIPRGNKSLIESTTLNAKVPVVETGAGNCHVYVDEFADIEMALSIADNAKTQRPSVCNSAETLLVHRSIADDFLPRIYERIGNIVEFRGDDDVRQILPGISEATEEDWYIEYNDYIYAVHIVDTLNEAIKHIEKYGTHNSDAIITENVVNADVFLSNVDSAAVYLNTSTRFTDGEEFGLSAEIGVSTSKIHARGPMGLKALTTTKTIVLGNGQIRE
ncbi:MAG: glutamate-5-semialdehyde dehydrogenase [Oscillospiraceae bacterium]|nr:glutamate-5-semialdehyde dehydrogenase [Oscillospiraceae bacterium]